MPRPTRYDILWSVGLLISAWLLFVDFGRIQAILAHNWPYWGQAALSMLLNALFCTALGAGMGAALGYKKAGAVAGFVAFLLLAVIASISRQSR